MHTLTKALVATTFAGTLLLGGTTLAGAADKAPGNGGKAKVEIDCTKAAERLAKIPELSAKADERLAKLQAKLAELKASGDTAKADRLAKAIERIQARRAKISERVAKFQAAYDAKC